MKLSSPNINNVLLLGCMVTYSSVFMESLEQQSVSLCKVNRGINNLINVANNKQVIIQCSFPYNTDMPFTLLGS